MSTIERSAVQAGAIRALLVEGKLADGVSDLLETTSVNAGEFRIDSLAFIRAFIAMEDEFDIEFGDDVLMRNTFATVGEVIDYVEAEIEKQRGGA